MERVKVQGWDVNVTTTSKEVKISHTNYKNLITNWDKVKKYRDMITQGSDYPCVILEEEEGFPGFYTIIDGAHRIKALLEKGKETVNSKIVISHNN